MAAVNRAKKPVPYDGLEPTLGPLIGLRKSSLWSLTHLCQFDILLAVGSARQFEEQQGGAQ
jgi:hypothetical protein